jgi:DNA-binding MarR family transcriptional regulator
MNATPTDLGTGLQPPATPGRGLPGDEAITSFVLTENVTHLLRRAHFRAEALFAEEFGDVGITPRQKALLIAAAQHPGSTVSQLANEIALDRQSAAEMLHRMVDRGYLKLHKSEQDRRAYAVDITPSGHEILVRVMPRDHELEERVLAPLPVEYRALFKKCLRLMVGLDVEMIVPGPGDVESEPAPQDSD